MNRKLSELKEKFIIYYITNDMVHIYSTPVNTITIDEFMKCDISCKNCLVQNMCLTEQNGGIRLQLCDRMKEFLNKNESLFNRVTFRSVH